jgi:pseudouridine-5'-phosphate glycosidase
MVALETAVATHGLPFPRNIDALLAMEEEVVVAGAVPAICLIEKGALWVGASVEQVEAAARDPAREKASVRDLGVALACAVTAGLTVSATLFAAELAGIRVFATGGIGGVHLGDTGDVSADLHQLARSAAVTVCSGAKSVLDVPRTLEYLETLGVPVFAYRSSTFPAFYLLSSGEPARCVDSVHTIAKVAQAQWELGYASGIVVGNPIPEERALHSEDWQTWLRRAREVAERDRVRGKDVTPYLLAKVAEYSEGRSVEANVALLRSNARLAGEIAVALAS